MVFESDVRNKCLSQVAVGVLLAIDTLQIFLLYQNIDAFLEDKRARLQYTIAQIKPFYFRGSVLKCVAVYLDDRDPRFEA